MDGTSASFWGWRDGRPGYLNTVYNLLYQLELMCSEFLPSVQALAGLKNRVQIVLHILFHIQLCNLLRV